MSKKFGIDWVLFGLKPNYRSHAKKKLVAAFILRPRTGETGAGESFAKISARTISGEVGLGIN